MAGRQIGRDAEKVTFEDLARMLEDEVSIRNKPRTLEVAKRAVKKLRIHFGSYRAIDIQKDGITSYVRDRLEEDKAAPATVRLEVAFLKWAFSVAVDAGKLDRKPSFPEVKVDNARQGFYEPEEYEAIKSHLPDHLKGIAAFLYFSGWRVGEVLPHWKKGEKDEQERTRLEGGLRWPQVDFKAGVVRLEASDSKNSEGRVLPFGLFPQLREVLLRQREYTDQVERKKGMVIPWVFHQNGRPIKFDFRHPWRKACKKAGLPGRIPHDFRRTAVRNLIRAGISETVAMKITGHRTRSVFDRYNITSNRDLDDAIVKLAAFHAGNPTPALPGSGTVLAHSGH